jgi:exopolyphosphatase/guanosine-5'-triphosphate,3'-diphosphate pyrophosphatase
MRRPRSRLNQLVANRPRRRIPPHGVGPNAASNAPAADLGSPIGAALAHLGHLEVAASIDIGSNSIHLLVAVIDGHELRPLVDESVLLGLGPIVDERGHLGPHRAETIDALRRYINEARDLHASAVTIIGTEPIRRAADSTRLAVELEAATGCQVHVVDHEEEALLTLLGVTGGRPIEVDMAVVDVGGGSSEMVVIGPGRDPVAGGLRVGSARLTASIVRHDPPTEAEIARLRAESRHRLASAPPGRPSIMVAVGGTSTNLLRVVPAAQADRTLTRRHLEQAMAVLATEPAAEAARHHGTSVKRARMLPAGAAILEALLEHYDLDSLLVSDAGVREGAILVVAHAGAAWRDQLPWLAHGWRT